MFLDDDAACQARVDGSRRAIEYSGTKISVLDGRLKQEIASKPPSVPGDEFRRGVRPEFPLCLLYTRYRQQTFPPLNMTDPFKSGTTGLPKGCAFTTERTLLLGAHLDPFFDGKPGPGGDRWYICMPLYHGTGAISAINILLGGLSLAIGKRFSVSGFWNDIHDSRSTFFIYVGETARYLLNAPPHQYERDHSLRGCYGNGHRPEIWEKFRARFNIPEIAEFYSSSEGMFSTVVWDKGSGYLSACVGHHGLILRRMYREIYVPVKIDETGDIWRSPETAFAKRVLYQDGGEIIVRISSEQDFQGYWKARDSTQKKFIRDVFTKGDLYYRTGDVLRRDSQGRWYFMDRLGDTFRWKSENVSTAEVATVLGKFPGVAEANVYGVLVPGHEGRAGCAALQLSAGREAFDYDALLKSARAQLPRYAVPVFIRKVETSTHIHNFKQNKVPLRNEGIDLDKIGTEVPEGKNDRFLWIPPRENRYVEFTKEDWNKLLAGTARL